LPQYAKASRFQVFTPFWKSTYSILERIKCTRAKRIPAPAQWPASDNLDVLGLLPSIDWAGGLRAAWQPGDRAPWKRWIGL
jgi:deoxyribodipyrimidine photo-lyase